MQISELKICQQQMCEAVKKYLEFISTSNNVKGNFQDRNYLELLRDIILINEKQKIVLSALRLEQRSQNGGGSSYNSGSEENGIEDGPEPDHPAFNCRSHTPESGNSVSPKEEVCENIEVPGLSCGMEVGVSASRQPLIDSELQHFHELVTCIEFMHSIGLLTIEECDDLLRNRKERQKQNAFSHVFCQAIWEKQETKRKKRDWLLSTSPPQLRRKHRISSLPSSHQASRSASPLDQASPPSSFSSPSPPSLATPASDETCSSCALKGASVQCEGCGLFYHQKCVEGAISASSATRLDWLCPSCEQRGLRNSNYHRLLRTDHQASADPHKIYTFEDGV